jgi:putative membrane-bound dehydrogenase-like protein
LILGLLGLVAGCSDHDVPPTKAPAPVAVTASSSAGSRVASDAKREPSPIVPLTESGSARSADASSETGSHGASADGNDAAETDADDSRAELLLAAADPKKGAPAPKKQPPRYTTRQNHDPNGIGKFYMGREIAHVMGYGVGGEGARWLERDNREEEERSSKMIEELKLQPGQVVADIGAGTGRLTLMMAEKVGNDGKVLAVDVQQEMLDIISVKLKQRSIKNVELVKGTQKSPKLKAESLDLALFVDVYHEFAFPYEMMVEISKAMKVRGRVVLVEFRKEDESVPIKLVHKMTEAQAKKELGLPELHLKWTETIGTLPWQHILVFEKQAEEDEPEKEGQAGGVTKPFPAAINTQDAKDKLLSPAEALAKIKVPEGFSVSLFAAEPDVQQPIAITTDERGRLWVAENYTYSENAVNFNEALRDRIVILEDTDGDGHFDERTVFWDGAKKLTSVEVGFGGVWALCAPELLFIPDANRDDVPDGKPVVLLDGWDASAVRHNIVNGLKWGPDGWLYGRHGILATSLVGKPGASVSQRVPINCGIWRYHPTRKVFEAVAHGTTNAWGFDYDDHGEMFFINTVIGHLWHVVPGAHYRRMYGTDFNPHLYQLIEQTADHFHWDTGEAWNDIRKGVSPTTDKAGGGHAHSGLMIYLGGNWPDRYRNTVFTVNLHGRRLNNDRLERFEAGYVGKHAPDFVQFDDPWFRGIDLVGGPDGGVYIADWSDVGECHENDGVHRTSGRIYKVSYGKPQPAAGFDMSEASDADLVRAQVNPNDWIVRQARRILQERAAGSRDFAGVRNMLVELLEDRYTTPQKLRGLWCLHAIGGLTEERLLDLLGDDDEHLRAWAVRLLADREEMSEIAVGRLQKMAADEESGLVQVYLAAVLQRLDYAQRWPIAEALSARDKFAYDRELPLMVWYGIEPAVMHQTDRAVSLATHSRFPQLRQYTARRLTVEIERLPGAVNSLVARLAEVDDPAVQLDILAGMSEGLRGWRKAPVPAAWAATAKKLSATSNPRVQTLARELAVVFGDGRALDELRQIVGDGNAEPEARRQALRTLVTGRGEGLAPLLQKLVADRSIANEAIRGLAEFDHADTPRIIFENYARLDPEGRAIAVNTLVSRPAYARHLLEAVAEGRISRSDISAFHARQIRSFDNEALTTHLSKVWGETRVSDADKRKLIEQNKSLLTAERLSGGNLPAGRALFNKTCANCHVLYGQGKAVGPDLTGSNRRNLDYVLENIIDPNASVAVDFRMLVAVMKDGRVITGFVVEKTDKTLTFLSQSDVRAVVERAEIEEMKPTPLSLMPEGLFQNLSEEQIRDLVAYLMSTEQVPLPAPASAAPIQTQTNPPKPETKVETVEEVLHGVKIADPYRWLEDQRSPATRTWIERQNRHTEEALRSFAGRDGIVRRLGELMKVDSVGLPTARGSRYFFGKQQAGRDLPVICLREGKDGRDEILIDPHKLSNDGSKTVTLLDVSQDGKLLAYGIRIGGEDELEVHFYDVDKRLDTPDVLERGRYFGVSLSADKQTLFYSRHRQEGSRVYRRGLDANSEKETLIFGEGYDAGVGISPGLSEDGRYLLINVWYGSAARKTEIFAQDLHGDKPVVPVVKDIDARFTGGAIDNRLFVQTNWKAPNGRVLEIDLDDPDPKSWKEILPEQKTAVLHDFSLVGGQIYANYLENVVSRVRIFDLTGMHLRDISFPALGSVSGVGGEWKGNEAFFSFSSFHIPTTIYRDEEASRQTGVWSRTQVPVESDRFEVRQVRYTSKDKTSIPMFLVHKKGLKLDGNNPTLLSGYGGFNISLSPAFSTRAVLWIEHGGVYAVPNLRGGGEFGESWHEAGMLDRKQNVFDDFLAAARWLIDNHYTRPEKLAITGRSNGGLLVGAALTQAPELFQAVICGYPLLDMIRYHQFLVAKFWVPEYGSSEDPAQFQTLLAYSPYHRVKPGTKYPAVLFMTGDADTRVDPLHARKMAALVQAATGSDRPVLLKYDTKLGHIGARPISQSIDDLADEFSFLFQELEVE